MPQKQIVSFRLHPKLAKAFQESARPYYGKTGLCFAAAVLMWLEADPHQQGEYLKKVFGTDVDAEIDEAIAAALATQASRVRISAGKKR